MPPFIATLGMLGIARGIVLVITDAKTVQGLPEGFQTIANGTIVGIPNLLIIAAWSSPRCLVRAEPNRVRPVHLRGRIQSRVGPAGRCAGGMVTISVYAISGLLAGFGGVLLTSRLGAGIPTAAPGSS